MNALVIAVGIIEALAFVGLMFGSIAKRRHSLRSALDDVKTQLDERKSVVTKVEEMLSQMVDLGELKSKFKELSQLRETLKTERGRVTITQAELETVDNRLRELEEIERELEASGIETKEELNILQKRQKELTTKNEALKQQLSLSISQIDELLSQIGSKVEVQERVAEAKKQLLQTHEKIDVLLLQIEEGNDQYFILKRRYDALDIEYAQLFEKFSDAESSAKG